MGCWSAVSCVLEAEPLVYLTKIIQGLVADCVLWVGGGALVYLTKIYQGLVACSVQYDKCRAFGVSDQDYPMAIGLQCIVCLGQSP